MNTFTRSSIELVSPSVSSGTSCPNTQCFLCFRSGFHTRIEALLPDYPKTLLKYIQTILGTYFTVSPIDLIPTAYKLSKNNRSFDRYVYYIIDAIKNKIKIDCLNIPALTDGELYAMLVKIKKEVL